MRVIQSIDWILDFSPSQQYITIQNNNENNFKDTGQNCVLKFRNRYELVFNELTKQMP